MSSLVGWVTLRLQEPEQKEEDAEEVFRQTEAIRSKGLYRGGAAAA